MEDLVGSVTTMCNADDDVEVVGWVVVVTDIDLVPKRALGMVGCHL
jgi:hypothetical protein